MTTIMPIWTLIPGLKIASGYGRFSINSTICLAKEECRGFGLTTLFILYYSWISIWDDYTRSWEATLQDAQGSFSESLARAVQSSKLGDPDETWLNYGIWTRSNSDRGDRIQLRHRYYSRRMVEFLGNLTLKDPKRIFGPLDREIIYWRENGRCQVCSANVLWDEAEVHHVWPHSEGGRTKLNNGALVHRNCHPKTATETREFADSLESVTGQD